MSWHVREIFLYNFVNYYQYAHLNTKYRFPIGQNTEEYVMAGLEVLVNQAYFSTSSSFHYMSFTMEVQ